MLISCQDASNPPFERTFELDKVIRNQIANDLNRYNTIKTNPDSIGIWIHPISRIVDNNAIYNYGQTATHSFRGSFFVFEIGDIRFLDERDTTVLYDSLKIFFERNRFAKRSQDSTIRLIKGIMNESDAITF